MKNMLAYAETLSILGAVAVVLHLLSSIDWPWAIAIGAAAAVLVRAALDRHTSAHR